jgi:hypothetical protein
MSDSALVEKCKLRQRLNLRKLRELRLIQRNSDMDMVQDLEAYILRIQ